MTDQEIEELKEEMGIVDEGNIVDDDDFEEQEDIDIERIR